MTKKIAIIGMGQIGRRHLQALTLIDRPIHIQVVDPNAHALTQAKKFYEEMKRPRFAQQVEYLTDIDTLSTNLHLVIIATTADVRKSIVEKLLTLKSVQNLILEKVVFQHPAHFSEINNLLQKKGVQTWVNCPLRMYPLFQQLKKSINSKPGSPHTIEYHLSGHHFNLASNAIHHLDLFSYLTNEINITLDASSLDKTFIDNKRKGFIEFTGTLKGKNKGGSYITLTSYSTGEAPLLLQISTMNIRCIAKFNQNKAWISSSPHWEWKEVDFDVPYQSKLTHLFIQQIFDENKCDLPAYSTSWQLHSPLLDSLTQHLQTYSKWREPICPIT